MSMKYRKNPVTKGLDELVEKASALQDEIADLRDCIEEEDKDERRKSNPYRR